MRAWYGRARTRRAVWVAVSLGIAGVVPWGGVCGQVRLYPSQGTRSTAGDSVRMVVVPGQDVRLLLTRGPADPAAVSLWLAPFADTLGNVVQGGVAVPTEGGPPSFAPALEIELAEGIQPVLLHVPELATPLDFSGALIVRGDAEEIARFHVTVRRRAARGPGVIVAEPGPDIVVPVIVGVRRGGAASFSVTLREQSGEWPVRGLVARVEGITSPTDASFDPRTDVTFAAEGSDSVIRGFWSVDGAVADTLRTLDRGAQRTLRGRVQVRRPGEYEATIRFTSLDASEDDDAGVVTLTVRARHSWVPVLLLLFGGVVLSFGVHKLARARVEQLRYRRDLDALETGWLQGEPHQMAKVRVQAMMRRARDLTTGFLLSWTDWLAGPMEGEKKRLARLERVARLRARVAAWPVDDMVERRALKAMRAVTDLLARPIGQDVLDGVDARLAALEQWNDPALLRTLYAADLQPDIDALLRRVDLEQFEDAGASARAEALTRRLDHRAPANAKLAVHVEREKDYARLKLLWESRGKAELLAALVPLSHRATVDAMFREADLDNWKGLEKMRWRRAGSENPGSVEAYDPIVLEIVPDAAAGDNYLFKHGCEFRWTLTLSYREPPLAFWRWERIPRPGPWPFRPGTGEFKLTPTTTEPRVVQFLPRPGVLRVQAEAVFDGERKAVQDPEPDAKIRVTRSTTFSTLAAFNRLELFSLAIAVVVAAASGLLMFYVDAPTFGSAKDYITVGLWALAVDQGKNFLQIYQGLRAGNGDRAPSGA